VFLDDRSRYVVSWALATRQTSDFVRGALLEGVARFGKPLEGPESRSWSPRG